MRYRLASLMLLILLMSCDNKVSKVNSPLVSIIKLISSEALGDYNEAKKYQDISKLYGKYAKDLSVSPEKYWIDYVTANNKLGRDKKFTNQLKYFNYNIEEVIDGDKSEVVFNNMNKSDRIQSIVYYLQLVDSIWTLQQIKYQTVN